MHISTNVAFLIGAGPHIGLAIATTLKSHDYSIAFGSRHPDVGRLKKLGFLPVTVDVEDPASITAAFAFVTEELGPPNVVVYNPSTVILPPVPSDPLTLPVSAFTNALNMGRGAFVTAQEALRGFRAEVHKGRNKTFLCTGNVLPFVPPDLPSVYLGLGMQKTISARLINLFSRAYARENVRFYFPSLVSPSGTLPGNEDFENSGPTHAKVYWELITRKDQGNWDHRFTLDGNKLPGYENH